MKELEKSIDANVPTLMTNDISFGGHHAIKANRTIMFAPSIQSNEHQSQSHGESHLHPQSNPMITSTNQSQIYHVAPSTTMSIEMPNSISRDSEDVMVYTDKQDFADMPLQNVANSDKIIPIMSTTLPNNQLSHSQQQSSALNDNFIYFLSNECNDKEMDDLENYISVDDSGFQEVKAQLDSEILTEKPNNADGKKASNVILSNTMLNKLLDTSPNAATLKFQEFIRVSTDASKVPVNISQKPKSSQLVIQDQSSSNQINNSSSYYVQFEEFDHNQQSSIKESDLNIPIVTHALSDSSSNVNFGLDFNKSRNIISNEQVPKTTYSGPIIGNISSNVVKHTSDFVDVSLPSASSSFNKLVFATNEQPQSTINSSIYTNSNINSSNYSSVNSSMKSLNFPLIQTNDSSCEQIPMSEDNILKNRLLLESSISDKNDSMFNMSINSLDPKDGSSRSRDILLSELHEGEDSNLGLGDNIHVNLNNTISDVTFNPEMSNLYLLDYGAKVFSNQMLPSLSSASDIAAQFLENYSMNIDTGPEADLSLNISSSVLNMDVNDKKKNPGCSSPTHSFSDLIKVENVKLENEQSLNISSLTPALKTDKGSEEEETSLNKIQKHRKQMLFSSLKYEEDSMDEYFEPLNSNNSIQDIHSSIISNFDNNDPKLIHTKSTSDQHEKLFEEVSCLKCSVCSFLTEDKKVMSKHMTSHSNIIQGKQKSSSSAIPTIPNKPNQNKQTQNSKQKQSTVKKTKTQTTINKPKPSKSRKKSNDTSVSTPDLKETKISSTNKENSNILEFSIPKSGESSDSGKIIKLDTHSDNSIPISSFRLEKTTPLDDPSKKVILSEKSEKYIAAMRDSISNQQEWFACGINNCVLKLKKEKDIIYHRKCHDGDFLVCPQCKENGQTFTRWSILVMHLWNTHMIDIQLYKCPDCKYRCNSYNKLVYTHMGIHGTARPFLCDTCGKSFKTQKSLNCHKALHRKKANSSVLTCDICQRKVSDKRMLESHMETVHKKVKPYLCNYCGKACAAKSDLGLHLRTHTGEKPFACDQCDYCTSDHNSIRRHKMKHTNERLYKCPYCSYTSIQSATYKAHLTNNHAERAIKDNLMFSCNLCAFKTIKKDNYLSHIAKHKETPKSPQQNENNSTPVATTITQPQLILIGDRMYLIPNSSSVLTQINPSYMLEGTSIPVPSSSEVLNTAQDMNIETLFATINE